MVFLSLSAHILCLSLYYLHLITMAGRQLFSETEKTYLQELIVKYKLNSKATGAGNVSIKKDGWAQLTNEFNAIESNSKRTENQLKKCWDNLKTRRKATLAAEKRERMRTGGGPSTSQSQSDSISTVTQDAMLVDEDVLDASTNVELTFAIDSDMTQEETLTVIPDTVPASIQQVMNEQSEERPLASQSRNAGRTGSRLSDHEGESSRTAGSRNYRNRVIQDEFLLREEQYKRAQVRDEELHKLKIAQETWLVKAAEALYKKNDLEREAAELKLNKLKNS